MNVIQAMGGFLRDVRGAPIGSGERRVLSETERSIVGYLQNEGRASYDTMARDLGLSAKVVRRIVEQLREERLIEITATIFPEVLGYKVTAFVELRTDGSRPRKEIGAELAQLDLVDYVAVTSGPTDIMLNVVCVDLDQLYRVVEEEIQPVLGANLVEVTPYLTLHYQKPGRVGPPSSLRRPTPEGQSFDTLDRQVVERLTDDGRAAYSQIARELDVSESHIRARVKRMTDSRVLRITAIAAPSALGYSFMIWAKVTVSGGDVEDVVRSLVAIDSVSYVAETLGSFDLMFELICADQLELRESLREIRQIPAVHRVISHTYFELFQKPMLPRVLNVATAVSN
jgi:DNA-binding Lrp family transcriptional regulator